MRAAGGLGFLVAVIALEAACVGDVDSGGSRVTERPPPSVVEQPLTTAPPGFSRVPPMTPPTSLGDIMVDRKGRQWVRRGPATRGPEPDRRHVYRNTGNYDVKAAAALDSLTDEELAERLRPVMLLGDSEYVPAKADVAAAKEMRAKIAAKASYAGDYNGGKEWRGVDDAAFALDRKSVVPINQLEFNEDPFLFQWRMRDTVAGPADPPWMKPVSSASQRMLGVEPTFDLGPLSPRTIVNGDYRLARGESYADTHPYRAAMAVSPGFDATRISN